MINWHKFTLRKVIDYTTEFKKWEDKVKGLDTMQLLRKHPDYIYWFLGFWLGKDKRELAATPMDEVIGLFTFLSETINPNQTFKPIRQFYFRGTIYSAPKDLQDVKPVPMGRVTLGDFLDGIDAQQNELKGVPQMLAAIYKPKFTLDWRTFNYSHRLKIFYDLPYDTAMSASFFFLTLPSGLGSITSPKPEKTPLLKRQA